MLSLRKTIVWLFSFLLLFILAACSSGASDTEPTPTPLPTPVVAEKPTYIIQSEPVTRTRLSWPEQLTLIQSKISAKDSKAVLDNIFAEMVFDPRQATDRTDPAIPFPVTMVRFEFLTANGETVSLLYYDVLPDRVISSEDRRLPGENAVEPKIELTQLPTMVRVGPLEACLSTLEVAQQILNSKATQMYCSATLTPYNFRSDEFQIPVVWTLIWTSDQGKKGIKPIGIFMNAETGERLKIMRDGVEIKP